MTGLPVAEARVNLVPREGRIAVPPVLTNSDGRFDFLQVPAGTYAVSAARPGYLNGGHGRTTPEDTASWLELRPGDEIGNLVVRLWRLGVIAGTVKTPEGRPAINAALVLLRQRVIAGQLRWALAHRLTSDDRGAFRASELRPGSYLLAAQASATGKPAFSTTFYPSTTSPRNALPLIVIPGGIAEDLVLQTTLVRSFTINGLFVTQDGRPSQGVIRLEPRDQEERAGSISTLEVQTGPSGTFQLRNVPAAQYVLSVVAYPQWEPSNSGQKEMRLLEMTAALDAGPLPSTAPLAPLPSGPTNWATVPIDMVDTDLENVRVTAAPGFRVTGRVVFTGKQPPPPIHVLPTRGIHVRPSDGRDIGSFPVGRLEQDATFKTLELPPGSYVIGMPHKFAGWEVLSIRRGEVDMLGHPFNLVGNLDDVVVTLTPELPIVSGTVRDATGRPRPDTTIVMFSGDSRDWSIAGVLYSRTRLSRPDQRGNYALPNAPGSYLIAAIEGVLPEAWNSNGFLEMLSKRAVRVELGGTAQITHQITSISIK